jgi:hypothetical protein
VSTRLVRRNVPVKNLTRGPAQPAANSTVPSGSRAAAGHPHREGSRHRQIHQGFEAAGRSRRPFRAISCASRPRPKTTCRR